MSVQTNLRSALEQLLGSIQNGIGSIASSTVLCRHAAVEALAGTTKYGCEEHEEIVGREQPASLHADMAESGGSRAVARSPRREAAETASLGLDACRSPRPVPGAQARRVEAAISARPRRAKHGPS